MSIITKMVGSFSGVVTYDDNTYEHFNSEIDDNGTVYTFNENESRSILGQIRSDTTWLDIFNSVIESIPLINSISWESYSVEFAKNITDANFRLSLTFAVSDNSSYTVGVIYQNSQLITQIPSYGELSDIANITNIDEQVQNIESMFDEITTSVEVTLIEYYDSSSSSSSTEASFTSSSSSKSSSSSSSKSSSSSSSSSTLASETSST